jgi:catalase (peroxidase I)
MPPTENTWDVEIKNLIFPKQKLKNIKRTCMKKVFALVAVVLCCSMSTVMAQPPGGGGQQQDPAARMAAMKERYKSMGLNDVQADSVIAIQNDMRPKQMALRDLTPEERTEKMKPIAEERNKRLEKALGADLAKKVIEAMSQQRPGGGRGGGQ